MFKVIIETFSILKSFFFHWKAEVQKKMRRSFSVPGNVKNAGFRRTNSQGLIRVVPVTPRPIPVDKANSTGSGDLEEIPPGIIWHFIP
jgi:hypothetical protein